MGKGNPSGAPSAPSAPPVPYQDPQSWQQQAHMGYSAAPAALSYSNSMRVQNPYAPPAAASNPSFSHTASNLSNYSQAPTSTASYGLPPTSTAGYGQPQQAYYGQPPPQQYGQQQYAQPTAYPGQASYPPAYGTPYGQQFNSGRPRVQFPPGTDPDAIRAFEMGDVNGSGMIDAVELGRVLSTTQPFSLRTVNLMIHLYSSTGNNQIGPTEFLMLWKALKEWKVIFERFDRDRSGRIDHQELRDALLSMGYAISPTLLQILISKYDRTGQGRALDYDNFIECGLVVKGLTDRFKAKDVQFSGQATLNYETFMQMVLPFIVA